MFDIHSHILYGVDDGPENINQSIAMLEAAAKEGITGLYATSHALHPLYDVKAEFVRKQVVELQQEIDERGINICIYTGQEIRINERLCELLAGGDALPLGESDYVLLELPSSHIPAYTKNIIIGCRAQGMTPIIAHPERNKSIAEKPERLEVLIREGAIAQITAGSLAGNFGKYIQSFSLELVKANMVHAYGSDAHNLEERPFLFNAGLDYLEKNKQADMVDILLENNTRIFENREIILLEPVEIGRKRLFGIF